MMHRAAEARPTLRPLQRRSAILPASWLWVAGLLTWSVPATAQVAVVRGLVYDSVGRAALAGAFVQVLQADRDVERAARRGATTDASGRFVIPDVPAGPILLGFYHPKHDPLGVEAPVRRVVTRADEDAVVDLAVPSPVTVVRARCGREALRDSTGLLTGYVLRATDEQPPAGAAVQARWNEIVIDARGARVSAREATALVDDDGFFALCGVPPGALMLLRAIAGLDSTSLVEVEVPDNGILVRSLYLGAGSVASGGSAAAVSVLRGIVESSYGEPLRGARVRLWGMPYETVTNSEGAYAFTGLPVGSHTLEARAIGYAPLRLPVNLLPNQDVQANLVMGAFPTVIDTVKVFGARPPLHNAPAEFENRRRLGYGTFLDADEIERRGPQVFTDLLRTMRGVQLTSSGMGQRVEMEGNGPLAVCEPLLVLDGMRVPLAGMNINDLIPSHVVRALEVYPRRLEAPPEYQTVECGTIVVWTGARGWLAKRATSPRIITPKGKKG